MHAVTNWSVVFDGFGSSISRFRESNLTSSHYAATVMIPLLIVKCGRHTSLPMNRI